MKTRKLIYTAIIGVVIAVVVIVPLIVVLVVVTRKDPSKSDDSSTSERRNRAFEIFFLNSPLSCADGSNEQDDCDDR